MPSQRQRRPRCLSLLCRQEVLRQVAALDVVQVLHEEVHLGGVVGHVEGALVPVAVVLVLPVVRLLCLLRLHHLYR